MKYFSTCFYRLISITFFIVLSCSLVEEQCAMTRCNRGYVRFGMEVVPLRQNHIIIVMVDYMILTLKRQYIRKDWGKGVKNRQEKMRGQEEKKEFCILKFLHRLTR